ncbi:hypothetical protein TIFTF001_002217 [Ficus carica]|uniref:Uncharacterized protein n=1 Tax=Ficus carica TaxID=3494 RepID=A0AA87Z3B8_FICCA|nr:hypothetical protein TIFTF001_002217 [Ficus carica]
MRPPPPPGATNTETKPPLPPTKIGLQCGGLRLAISVSGVPSPDLEAIRERERDERDSERK